VINPERVDPRSSHRFDSPFFRFGQLPRLCLFFGNSIGYKVASIMQETTKNDNDYLLTTDVALELKASSGSVLNWERQGLLRALKTPSGVRLFKRQDVEKFKRERQGKRS
jgi:hypothetical protein